MLDSFLELTNDREFMDKSSRILLAASGGLDSMVLMDLLHKTECKVVVAHCNFNLRDAESDGDESFVKAKSLDYKFEFYAKHFETNKYAKESGLSIQMAARDLRYIWFDQLSNELGIDQIATAHHLNDSLETAILNFIKGTGVAGLRGILNKNQKIIRPLIHFTREEIANYAKINALEWREDSSNSSNHYQRNLLRNEVIPLLRTINPSIEKTFERTSKRLSSLENLLEVEISKARNKFKSTDGDHSLSFDALVAMEQVVLEGVLSDFGFNWDQTQSIIEAVSRGESGKEFIAHDYILTIDRNDIIISSKDLSKATEESILSVGEYFFNSEKILCYETPSLEIIKNKKVAKLDFDKLRFPLKLRNWEQGDSFQPLGMTGKKKLSDFMIDEKIPLNLKRRVGVITSGEDIVWVVGHRIDDRYKITNKTKKAFVFELKK